MVTVSGIMIGTTIMIHQIMIVVPIMTRHPHNPRSVSRHGREPRHATALGLAPETLPIFLRLRRLTSDLLEQGLEGFIEAELAELSGGTLPAGLGAELSGRRRLVLLLDGLDEIADPHHRSKVLARLGWWLREPALADVRAVVSCRYAGWSAEVWQVAADLFEPLDVRPFDDAQITRLVELWFREVGRRGYLDPALAAERAAQLTQALTHPERRRQDFLVLVSTPLLLTLLCLVVMRGGQIPRRRVDFFEECLRILLREWRARQTEREPPVSSERALKLLGALAWQLHASHRRDDLSFPEALKLFRSELEDSKLAARAFRWLLEDVALLDRYTESHYGFVHLHFQEHFAARHLAEHEELLELVCTEHGDSWWREVIELLAGMPGGKGFAPLVRRLLQTEVPLHRADLLAACLEVASDPDLEPFYELLRGEAETERKVAVLRLLRGRTEPALIALAEELAANGAAELRGAAQQVVDAARSPVAAGQADVFLIHASGDRRPAEHLAGLLAQRGYRVDRPCSGERWDEPRVFERMSGCPTLLVLLGTEQPASQDVLNVIELAEGEAVVVLLPGDPRPAVPMQIAELRRVDLRSFADAAAIDALVAAPAVLAAAPVLRVIAGEPFTEPLTGELFLPVPAGRFQMGGTVHDNEQPVHWVRLSAFWLARTPVTNGQYRLFLEATGHPEPATWRDRRLSAPSLPVVNVSWEEAVTYCCWLSQASPSGQAFSLPTEAQWEFAARGTESREYPWGQELPDKQRACLRSSVGVGAPADVGSHVAGAGPFDHLDLAGNVWEWCGDFWEPNYERWAKKEPCDPVGEANVDLRPLRGGSWWDNVQLLRSACRRKNGPTFRNDLIGFRVSAQVSNPVL